MDEGNKAGKIFRISGPVVVVKGIHAKMYDVTKVGNEGLIGEVIQIAGDKTVIQVYEDTSGLRPGEKAISTNAPLSATLGPGLLTSIYDGIQRPLPELEKQSGSFIARGLVADPLPRKEWEFKPVVRAGQNVAVGTVIGEVRETETITHRILATAAGKVKDISSGKFKPSDIVCTLETGEKITLAQQWPVRRPRPVKRKLGPDIPLITGQRVFDALFPLAKGGAAAIPGPFGAGKTVSQQQLAKWCDADIIVYVGCGERGNEMTEVLSEFPHINDPRTGKSLMNRTVLIANTSNMPVAAREASVYTGMTIAEYYRDMGYSVALMADSTSRWAEAMREISSRLEEMPGEEGYPAYLASRIAEFYERAGRAINLAGTEGSVTAIGAVSPPGGDFSEPVTQNTLRVTKTFWALDARLAQRRHFPSINWLTSYSLYKEYLEGWFRKNVSDDWMLLVNRVMALLQEEETLLEIVQLVGSDALPERQQLVLEVARMLREFLLQQNAYHEVDTYCEPKKTYLLMKTILDFNDMAAASLQKGAGIRDVMAMKSKELIANVKFERDYAKFLFNIEKEMRTEFEKVQKSGQVVKNA